MASTVLTVLETLDPPVATSNLSPGTSTEKQTFIVSDLALFGEARQTAAIPQVVNAPETSLNLELQGVFLSQDEGSSTAIIGQKNKAGELYAIGDRIPGNAELAAVHQDHVLLRRNGRMEKLLFSDSKYRVQASTPAPTEPVAGSSQPRTNTMRDNLQRIRDRMRGGSMEAERAEAAASSSGFAEVRQRLMQDPSGTLASAGITAVTEGEASGYRVGDDAPGPVKQSGLQPGDVILSVNGRPVGAASSDTSLMNQVMSASRVRVEVQRGERRFFLTVPVPK